MTSFHMDVQEPDAEGAAIVQTTETTLQTFGDEEAVQNGVANLNVNGDETLRTQRSGRKEVQG